MTQRVSVLAGLSGAAMAVCLSVHAGEPAKATDGIQNLTVVRDAETGQLRAPNAEEVAAMKKQQLLRSQSSSARVGGNAPAQPQLRVHSDGARSMRATPDVESQLVAVRNADGSLSMHHIEGSKAAQALVNSAAKAAPSTAQPAQE